MATTGNKKELLARRIAAAGLGRGGSPASGTPATPAPGRREQVDHPLSFAQRRMWLHQQIVPDSAAYNLCIELTFTGEVSHDALVTAFREVLRHHEILRTTYHDDAGTPYQRVHAEMELELERVDLSDVAPQLRRDRVGELARSHAARPYDLRRDSSLRVVLVSESPDTLTVLLLVHHIAWDGLTFAAFSRDIERFYRDALAGTTAASTPPAFQFADHAGAEQHGWDDDAQAAELDFWRARLSDPTPALFDGMAGEREDGPAEDGRRVDRRMSAAATDGLRVLARRLDTTPYNVFLSCYLAVLSRFGSTGDVAVGTAVINREDPRIVDLVGNFGNIVVLRSEVRTGDSFLDLVARVKQVCADGFAHQEYPYDKLVEKLNPERTTRGGGLFDAMLLFLTQRIEGPQLPGARTSWFRTDNLTAQHPLAVEVFLTADGMNVEATYATAALSGAVVAGLLAELETLIENAAAHPERALGELMAPAQALAAVAAPAAAGPLMPELFRARVAAEGRSAALVAGDRVVSYAELGGRAEQLAVLLRARGVGPESRVAIVLPRTVDLVVAVLGVLAAGGVVVPVDSSYPTERIDHMVTDSAPTCVVTTDALAPGLPATAAGIVTMDALREYRPDAAALAPVPLAPAHAAYLVYTSGSTGRPKGVVGTHGGLAARLAWAQQLWPVEPGQVCLAKSSISFIDGLTELLAALLGGAKVVLADDRAATDMVALARLVADHEVSRLTAVPSVVAALAEVPEVDLTSIGRWVCSGEPLTMAVAHDAAAAAPGAVVTNSYGSSEVAGDVLVGDVDGHDRAVTVGRAVPGTGIRLLDRFLNPVPAGVVGEVHVAGVQVARGYTGLPGLTASRFVADPSGDGTRLYRTGDLGRVTPDGRVQLLGRIDHQVKVRGVRVEPGEVEAVLAEHEQVARAAVIARDDLPGGVGLVGYLVPAGAAPLDTEQVRRWLRKRLPVQLVPAVLTVIEALPRTPGGKLDRAALPAPTMLRAGASRAPRTDRERSLCALFGELLGRDGVGPDDDFFSLGGHSLLALRLVNRLKSGMGVEVSVAELFTSPTVAALAQVIEASSSVVVPPLTALPRTGDVVLSAGQQQMWGLAQLEGPSPTYNVPRVWRVDGPLDVAALHAALADVVSRHEVLRTTYRSDGVAVVQRVHAPGALDLPVEFTAIDAAELDSRVAAAVRHCFDLERESPIRVAGFTLSPDEHVVTLVVHHIAVDEWSYRMLLADLSTAYAARRAGTDPGFAPLPVQYADYARWQRELVGAGDDPASLGAQQLEYWEAALSGAPPETTLPLDRPRPEVPSGRGGVVAFELDPQLTGRLLAVAERHQVSMFMLMHAAVAVLLSKHGAGEDVVIGTPISGRRDDALENLVGYFLNTLAVRVDLSGNPTLAELLGRVRDADLAAMRRQDVPFERVVERLRPERSAARNPLFQVQVVYLRNDLDRSEVDLDGAAVTPVPTETGTAKFDATFEFFEGLPGVGDRTIRGMVEYAVELFDPSTVHAVVDRLRRLLTRFADDAAGPLSDIAILSSGDQLRLLDRRQAGPATPDRPRTLVELFERSAVAAPGGVALVAGAERLSYAELDERANRVARLLLARGCGLGTRVGIGIPRSADMVVALLGVLKAGGTYVPVDVSAPAERLALILGDAAPGCVLTVAAVHEAFSRVSAPLVLLDDPAVAAGLAELSGAPLDTTDRPFPASSQPAYVIYTSGSTGRPKGVEVSHGAVLDLVVGASAKFEFAATDVWTLFHSVAFDVSVFEMWGAFAHGARVVVVDHVTARTPDQLWELIAAERVTVLSQTPSAFYQLAEAEPADRAGAESLRYIVFAGEALEPRRLRRWYERHAADAPRLVNMYGITETTVHATYRELDPAAALGSASPVGGPLPGLGIHVLDQHLNLAPAGVVGEVYVAGGQLAQGYAERPDLTAARFVANPFGSAGDRLYRSGDLARWTLAGELEFVGRADDQVKLRGFRIELGEVEAALLALPGVAQAVAVVREDVADHRQLVGYVVGAAGAGLDIVALRAGVADTLPDYMVPAAVVTLDAIPLTVNGKLDRRALPAPDFTALSTSREPRNRVEEILCGIYADILGLDRVGIDDDFFTLGGDSILAIQVAGRARREQIVVSPRDIFRSKTPAALAELARTADELAPVAAVVEPVRITPLPIVHRLAEFAGTTRRYNQSALVEFPAGRSADTFEAALQAVLDRHDALRQRLDRSDRTFWEPAAMPPGTVRADTVARHLTLPDLDLDGGLATLAAEADAATGRLDPEAGVMIQVVTATAPGAEHGLLLVVAHHLAVDGVSWHILLDDLEHAWRDAEAGTQPVVPPVATSLAEFGEIVSDQARSKRYLAEYEHWQQVLVPEAPLVAGFGGGATLADVEHRTVSATSEITRRVLVDLPAQRGTDPTDVLLAALARAFSTWRAGLGEVTVDLERHGREALTPEVDLSRTVGWFTTVSPVRLTADPDPGALLDAVGAQLRGTVDAGIGYGMLRHLHPQLAARMARVPRPQVLVNYLGRFDADPRYLAPGDPRRAAVRTDADADMEMPYALEINAMAVRGDDGPQLDVQFSAPRDVIDAADLAALAQHWLDSLAWIAQVSG